jgi:hypothetical protein
MSFVRTALALLVAAPFFGADTIVPGGGNSLVAHEWGTFTSVTGADGGAVVWGALGGPADLPCFVHRQQVLFKNQMFTRVRMETPVVYFYSHRPITASLHVRFPAGTMTEWYPRAEAGPRELDWKKIEVLPGADPEYPAGKGDSHYYAARETDASPLRVGEEREKLLFYRGTGDFQPPALPKFTTDGKVELRGVGQGVLFENRSGKIGWRIVNGPGPVARPELTGDLSTLRSTLVDLLTEAGLYQKEARAMVETWRDSWFEEGLRVLYLVPREFVDRVLPLEIEPAPRKIERVFMGRAELLPPERHEGLAAALAIRDGDALRRYGRFLAAFGRLVTPATNERAMQYIAALEAQVALQAQSCVK